MSLSLLFIFWVSVIGSAQNSDPIATPQRWTAVSQENESGSDPTPADETAPSQMRESDKGSVASPLSTTNEEVGDHSDNSSEQIDISTNSNSGEEPATQDNASATPSAVDITGGVISQQEDINKPPSTTTPDPTTDNSNKIIKTGKPPPSWSNVDAPKRISREGNNIEQVTASDSISIQKYDWSQDRWKGAIGFSYTFLACEANLPGSMSWQDAVEQFGKQEGDPETLWGPTVRQMFSESHSELTDKKHDKFLKALNKLNYSLTDFARFLFRCHALLSVTTRGDYGNKDLFKKDGEGEPKSSRHNPRLTCRSRGWETQDYKSCVRLLNVYDTFVAVKKGAKVGETLAWEEKKLDIEEKFAAQRADTSSALDTQKNLTSAASDFAAGRGALSGSEAVSLESARRMIPTPDMLGGECMERMGGKAEVYSALFEKYIREFTQQVFPFEIVDHGPDIGTVREGGPAYNAYTQSKLFQSEVKTPDGPQGIFDAEAACGEVLDGWGIQLLMNQGARQAAVEATTMATVTALAETAKAALLADHAKKIGQAKQEIEDFTPEDSPQIAAHDAMVQECEVNPEAPGCANSGPEYYGMGGGTLTIGSAGQSSNIEASEKGQKSIQGTQTTGTAGNKSSFSAAALDEKGGSFGSSGLVGRAPAAIYKDGEVPTTPGGGSPGLGGAAPPGGSVGGAPGGAGSRSIPKPSVKISNPGNKLRSSGGGSYSSGRRRPRGGGRNPLKGMLGNKGKKGKKTLKFSRAPASLKKASGLFKRVSARYQWMLDNDLLHGYNYDDITGKYKFSDKSADFILRDWKKEKTRKPAKKKSR